MGAKAPQPKPTAWQREHKPTPSPPPPPKADETRGRAFYCPAPTTAPPKAPPPPPPPPPKADETRELADLLVRISLLADRVARLREENHGLRRERHLMAQLAGDRPEFFNPAAAWAAKKLRDEILEGKR